MRSFVASSKGWVPVQRSQKDPDEVTVWQFDYSLLRSGEGVRGPFVLTLSREVPSGEEELPTWWRMTCSSLNLYDIPLSYRASWNAKKEALDILEDLLKGLQSIHQHMKVVTATPHELDTVPARFKE